MTIQEKILYCRKRASLSQEALAEKIGVSRQAISKWETGESVPEINKLLLLANTFGVTTDWLLSDDEPEEQPQSKTMESEDNIKQSRQNQNASWVDSVPGALGRLFRRFGWLLGVYVAIIGAGFTTMGALMRFVVRKMFSFSGFDNTSGIDFGVMFNESNFINDIGAQMNNTVSNIATNNPVSIMGLFIMILGIIMMVIGIVLAIILKRYSKK